MGETYGFNVKTFEEYKDCKADYAGVGYDQLKNLVHLLKTDPTSRRMIITLWNPATLHNAALLIAFTCISFMLILKRNN